MVKVTNVEIVEAVKAGEKTLWITEQFKCSHMTVIRIKRKLGLTKSKFINHKYKTK